MKDYKLIRNKSFWFTLLCAGFVLSLTLWFDFGPDQAIYSYIAMVWKKYHLLPYVGAFAYNFPGTAILHRLVLEIFGNSMLGLRIFDFLGQSASLVMIYYLAFRLSGKGSAGFLAGMFYSIFYIGLNAFNTAQKDDFVLWFLLAAVCITLYLENWRWLGKILTGLLLGFAFLLKPTYGLTWPVLGIWFLVNEFKARPKLIWAELLAYSLSCLLPALVIILIYWQANQLKELYWSTIWYGFEIYAKIAPVSFPGRIIKGMIFILYSLLNQTPLTLSAAGFGILFGIRNWRELKRRKEFSLVLLMMISAYISCWAQGRNNPYHHTPVLGFAFILSGAGWAWMGSQLENRGSIFLNKIFAWTLYLFLVVLMLAGLPGKQLKFFALYPYRGLERAYAHQEHIFDLEDQRAAAAYLKPLLRPEDQIEYLGWHPFLPYLLGKKIPTRFCAVSHLLMRHYDGQLRPRQVEWRKEFVSSIITARPRFFIISTYKPRGETMLLKNYDLKSVMENEFPELYRFFKENYRLVKLIGLIEIYELVPEASQ